jgi:chromate transporter
VVGIIANLAVWFALHVLFRDVGEWLIGPVAVPVPDFSTLDVAAAAIAVAAGVALIRYHANMIVVLSIAALAGLIWMLA